MNAGWYFWLIYCRQNIFAGFMQINHFLHFLFSKIFMASCHWNFFNILSKNKMIFHCDPQRTENSTVTTLHSLNYLKLTQCIAFSRFSKASPMDAKLIMEILKLNCSVCLTEFLETPAAKNVLLYKLKFIEGKQ